MTVQTQRQMILWTIVLVMTFGFVIGLVLLQPPTPEDQLEKSPRYAKVSKLRQKRLAKTLDEVEARRPASERKPVPPVGALAGEMQETSLSPDAAAAQVEDLELACNGEQKRDFGRFVAQVRLTGKACTPGREIESTEIRNDSNGSNATVFATGTTTFMTDYFALAPGSNHIRILHIFKSGGKEERSYLIEREAMAKR